MDENKVMHTGEANWTNPDTGVKTPVNFDYDSITSFEDAVVIYRTEAEACRHLQRMCKTDARNNAAAKAKSDAGFGAPVMTEEEKAEKKAARATTKAISSAVQGLSEEDVALLPEAVRRVLGY